MLGIFTTKDGQIMPIDTLGEKGSWVNLVAPTEEELTKVHKKTGVPLDLLRYPLDEEEISRIETDGGCILIIIKIPVVRETYDTIPLGIIILEDLFITVCLEKNELLDEFVSAKPNPLFTFKKPGFCCRFYSGRLPFT